MALLTIRQLCPRENNAFKFLFHDTVPKLLLMLELETTAEHHESAALALEQLVYHRSFKDWWHDVMRQGGLTSIITHLRPGQPLPVRLACACVLRALSQYEFYGIAITRNALDVIAPFKTMNSDFQEVYTELVGNLMIHADEKTIRFLNADALPSSLNMLQQGPCGVQQQALNLISSLAGSASGIQAILNDSSAVPMILSAMINTECRKTRQNAALALSKITETTDAPSQKRFLLQVDIFHHETEDRIEAAAENHDDNDSKMVQKLPDMTDIEKMERAIADIGKDLVQLISKLGKMEKDLIGNTIDIHLAPCFDTDTSDLTTLCHVLKILANLLRFAACQVQLKSFEEEHLSQKRIIKALKQSLEVNYKICQILVKQNISCVTDLLSVYTQKLLDVISICSKPLKSMGGMSKSQLLFQAWGSQSDTMSNAGKVNITSIFDANEAEVVTHLLQVLSLISFSTTSVETDQSDTLELKISEKIASQDRSSVIHQVPSHTQKTTKKSSKQFHSKVACELCQKGDKAPTLKSRRKTTKANDDQSLQAQEAEKCEHKEGNDCSTLDSLEEAFRTALAKQISRQQRETRIALYEGGLVESVAPWIMSSDSNHQTLVLSVLRSMVQPVSEKISPSPPKQPKLQNFARIRTPAINMTAKERDTAMDVALYQMSSRMKQFIEEALGRNANAPQNSPRDTNIPQSAAEMMEGEDGGILYKHTENEIKAVRSEERKKRLQSATNSDSGYSSNKQQANSNSNISLGNSTYRQEDYDKFARSNSSMSLKSSRSVSHVTLRPNSAKSRASVTSVTTISSVRSNSVSRVPSAKTRSRRHSVSPRRRRRPSSAAPTTKPLNGYQVIVKPTDENKKISIAKSIDLLSSSSSDSISDSVEVTPQNFPVAVYDLERPKSELNVSDIGHQCDNGTRPKSRSNSARNRPLSRINSIASVASVENVTVPIGQRYPKRVWVPWKPQLQLTQGVAEQCRCLVAMVIGKVIVQQVFAKDQQMRKNVLEFMDQYVKHGQVGSHMKMSEQGIMPRMVDFLRVNEDDQLLEMMGLSVVGQLLKSDQRLVDVFKKHGGTDLLVSMSNYSSGPLRQSVKETLTTATKAEKIKSPAKRVLSAPLKRSDKQDIWDQIMQRWKQEDKLVKEVLQKFNP